MTAWLHPEPHADELPRRPTALRVGDPVWRQLPPRRLPAYVESSVVHGLQWVVFEPNGEATWNRVLEQVTDFLDGLWRAGRLQGTGPRDAYFVRCDLSTMTQDDVDNGRLVAVIGVAPLRPAEFVVFRIGLWTSDPAPDPPDDCAGPA